MLYLGGKGRIGKEVAATILASTRKRGRYVEPFLGGGSAFKSISPHFDSVCASDSHIDLMLMWMDAANGWIPPEEMSEDIYRSLRLERPSALRGIAGFGSSFGGKWWGGYARSSSNPPGYYARHAANSVLEISRLMPPNKAGELRCCDYSDWDIDEGTVVYADPPYANTTKYKETFNSVEFWARMEEWARIGADVFVSEYAAPESWRQIWQKDQARKVSGGTGEMTTERLFVYCGEGSR